MKKPDRRTLALIFSGIAVVGVGVSNFLTAYRSPQFEENLEKCDGSKPKAIAKTYWPTFVAAGLTCTSIVLAEQINLKEIAAITGVCTYLVNQRNKVVDAVKTGDINNVKEAFEQTTNPQMEEKISYYCKAGPSVEETERGDLLCFEEYSGRWFRSSEVAVNQAIEKMNRSIKECESVCLNDLYFRLGITQTKFGYDHGWPGDEGFSEMTIFGSRYFNTGEMLISATEPWFHEPLEPKRFNDEPVLVIEIYEAPMEGWIDM